MTDTMLIDNVNHERVTSLRTDGCRRCARTRSRWIMTEFRRIRRTA